MTKSPTTMPSFTQVGAAGNPRRHRWLSGAMVTTMAAALVIIPVGAASAAPDDDTIANVVVNAGIAIRDLPASFTLTGQPGDLVEEATPFTYNVITNNPSGYSVTVQAADDVLVGADIANSDTIAITRLTIRDETVGLTELFSTLSDTVEVTAHTQSARSAIDGDTLISGFQMLIPVVAPDTYTVTLDYLATVTV